MIRRFVLTWLMAIIASAVLFAQTNSLDGTIEAVIRSGSGSARHLHGNSGYIGRAGLRPGQTVGVTLLCPGTQLGGVVLVTSPDGGEITSADNAFLVGADLTVVFSYQGATSPGLYRLLVRVGGRDQRIEFYVLDTEHPENNSARVRIVD